ncbi:MAG: D-alanyl-D-alanine carboxypeptidase [Proteobacteria bacterium]|nr:D-alanyl-D-alanine carboxypeptidase [Pseudomonadota bacterium]
MWRWPHAGPGGFALALPLACLFLTLGLILSATQPASARSRHHHGTRSEAVGLTDPSKDAALILDGETGKVLYSRNAYELRHPASLTKMMTLYMLFEALQKGQMTLSTPMPVSYHASLQRPTKLSLQPGDSIDVDNAIKAIVIRSANDVAVTIAESLGGTETHFAEMMTEKARQLGMRNTFYRNASGLPDSSQISTAADLAILARHLAYDFPQYFHYFATPSFSYRGRYYTTHDNLIGNYDGADGIKTGYTEASGFNLVSSVVRNGAHIIGVVMGGRTAHKRDREMIRLLDATFAQINDNPKLVARAELPWQTIAQGPKPNPIMAGFQLGNMNAAVPQRQTATFTPNAKSSDPEDEDSAESRADTEDNSTSANVIAAQAPPKPQTVVAAYSPQIPAVTPAVTPKPRMVDLTKSSNVDMLGSVTRKAATALGVRDWTIQIGAFADMVSARQQLAAYAEKSLDVLGQAERIVVPFQGVDGHTLYRARFGPFVEREAREVCARLTERGQTCFAATAR